ncbi:aminopeptidase [Slackia equolifaciens]|uniref:M18 family aminopeptidase n=1 Tax=Slackia equolifaciens TaxID=498718 RepID=A0A3N0ARS8_9ACTN|nr:aminopeptidase [Slackia equolifaciens]RNL37591.1 aminopeptidase [Slackia equolifaciens]
MEHPNAWNSYDDAALSELESLAQDYRRFISENKTERECAATAIAMAREAGYISLDEARAAGRTLAAGDKVYAESYGKTLILAHIGTRPLEDGLNILGAHIDSPRLDIKQNPLYESGDLALLDTHYYGGVKKYQWVTLPLAIHGVIAKKDGTVERVNVGEDAGDPVFCVTDLLIHLAGDQMQKKASEVVEGEALDVLAGSRPMKKAESKADDEKTEIEKLADKEPVKALLLSKLAEKYNMEEADFLSSELEVVPAGPARDCGFDRSMILGYGHDDRVCAYPSLVAQLEATGLEKTGICILVDKEEIGSVGATGMTSMFFENTIAEIMDLAGQAGDLPLRRCLANSSMLSSDVSAGFDPSYASAFETKNTAYLGRGVVFNKFTGSRGKSGSNDANAEYMAKIRAIMEKGGAAFQTAELGKVDVGGGGTIAYILAKYGMNVIDCGVAVLSMHAPWEVIDKADLYEALKAYRAFLKWA